MAVSDGAMGQPRQRSKTKKRRASKFPSTTPRSIAEFARRLKIPGYKRWLRAQLKRGTLKPSFEEFIWKMAFGASPEQGD
jgi:hypothetical protein